MGFEHLPERCSRQQPAPQGMQCLREEAGHGRRTFPWIVRDSSTGPMRSRVEPEIRRQWAKTHRQPNESRSARNSGRLSSVRPYATIRRDGCPTDQVARALCRVARTTTGVHRDSWSQRQPGLAVRMAAGRHALENSQRVVLDLHGHEPAHR